VRRLLLVAVVLIAPRIAVAKPSLAKAAVALCRCDETYDARGVLGSSGERAVAPLLEVTSSRACEDYCEGGAFEVLIDSLCKAQVRRDGKGVTGALAPLRAALESDDPRRAENALEVLVVLTSNHVTQSNFEKMRRPRHPSRSPVCSDARPLVVAATPSIARMLARTKGKHLQEALTSIAKLKLAAAGAPLVPALTRLLDSERAWEPAARLLASFGGAAAPAAPRLGRKLAATTDLVPERTLAWTIAAIGATTRAAAAALPPRLDESVTHLCDAGLKRFPVLFRAAVASGPPRGQAVERWQAEMTMRDRTALDHLAKCPQPTAERDLIVALTKLPRDGDRLSLLEAEMMNATASAERRYWAAWALREYGATLTPASANTQVSLLGPADRAPRAAPDPEPDMPELTSADITRAINEVKPSIAECHPHHLSHETAIVQLDVALGRITSARITGELAGTAIGACVTRALEAAHFPLVRTATMELRFRLGDSL
jgi:hypothetical protein